MANKITAMQIMLYELKLKQIIYEQSGMHEAATALVTSIETAKELLAIEKEQIIEAAHHGVDFENSPYENAEQYYNETYGN
jgi:hypothetical protein